LLLKLYVNTFYNRIKIKVLNYSIAADSLQHQRAVRNSSEESKDFKKKGDCDAYSNSVTTLQLPVLSRHKFDLLPCSLHLEKRRDNLVYEKMKKNHTTLTESLISSPLGRGGIFHSTPRQNAVFCLFCNKCAHFKLADFVVVMVKIGVNGFGRIGRLVVRRCFQKLKEVS
jgi:hypothetical protein